MHTATTYALFSLLGFGSGYWLRSAMLRPRSRASRRGGYIRPTAYAGTNPGATGTRSAGRAVTAVSSSSTPPGVVSAGAQSTHPTLDPWSRRIGPTSSGNATADRGASGARPAPADCDDCA